jgi:hypothetical protein
MTILSSHTNGRLVPQGACARNSYRVYPESSFVSSPFSPPAFQVSLQTSNVQAHNRTTGAELSLIKKCDVNDHLAARRRRGILHCSVTKPAATALPAAKPAVAKVEISAFAEDFVVEHAAHGVTVAATARLSSFASVPMSIVPRRPRQ